LNTEDRQDDRGNNSDHASCPPTEGSGWADGQSRDDQQRNLEPVPGFPVAHGAFIGAFRPA
jgi:hypothetical protein